MLHLEGLGCYHGNLLQQLENVLLVILWQLGCLLNLLRNCMGLEVVAHTALAAQR